MLSQQSYRLLFMSSGEGFVMLPFSEEEARGSESCSGSSSSQGKRLRLELGWAGPGLVTNSGHHDDLQVTSASSHQPKVSLTERAESASTSHPPPAPLKSLLSVNP